MKVDKAVCTETYEDLSRAIRFEAVFSTLVENKILAIKRECEQKKRNKKSKVIRRILFGRKSCRKSGKNGSIESSKPKNASPTGDNEQAEEEVAPVENVENEIKTVGDAPPENSIISDGIDEVIVEIGDLSSLVDADGNLLPTGVDDTEARSGSFHSKSELEGNLFGTSETVNGGVTSVNVDQVDSESAGAVGGCILIDDRTSLKSDAIAQSIDDDRKSIMSNDGRFRERCSTLEPVSVSIEIEPHSDPLSTQYDLEDSGTNVSIELDASEISDMKRSIASDPVPIIKNISKYCQGSPRQPSLLGVHRLRVLEAKSISAQNSPILPRQKSTEARHLTFSTATYQTTSLHQVPTKSNKDIEDTSFVIDLSRETGAGNGDTSGATSNLSNCNSIVIPMDKHQPALLEGSKRSGSFSASQKKSALVVGDSSSSSASRKNKLNPASTSSDHHHQHHHHHHRHSKRLSDVVVEYDQTPPQTPGLIESFNQLTSPNLPVITMRQSASPVSDMIKLHRLSAAGGGSRSGTYSAQAQLPNQEYSQQTKPAQLTTTIISELSESGNGTGRKHRHGFLRQSSCDVELHYRPSSGASNPQQHQSKQSKKHDRHKSSRDRYSRDSFNRATTVAASSAWDDYGDDPVMMAELNESDEEKLNKRKYKYLKRCSDPVIVFPTTSTGGGLVGAGPSGTAPGGFGSSGLQHCILSRPPNQPIQFPYDEDFMYDVSLQLEPDRHGELDSIVPEHKRRHKHRHHQHHHCKKKRHKKRKILVHDLDDQSVKVIDPDDLPQRARWTIIATACLLLIMCLLLVGITLRMAPIIDDMGKSQYAIKQLQAIKPFFTNK
ncbi:uncharacterized protein LOC128737874 isoform X2 [Sabethes cyaneus]|uniref:uncharacterized protein LOC128737874 isoform X2 n=1 Tax=Sabethes cyaneus TaxID=53552 RepID=UPI00237DA8B4|nr:uncharacterized protein LOC128737874 isoform X2 [Sabethes cyaneus]